MFIRDRLSSYLTSNPITKMNFHPPCEADPTEWKVHRPRAWSLISLTLATRNLSKRPPRKKGRKGTGLAEVDCATNL